VGGTGASQPDKPAVVVGQNAGFADVLCAVDGTPESLAAVGQAAALAGPKALLTLLAVTSFRFSGDHRGPAVGPIDAKRMLDAAIEVAKQARVPSTVEVDPASPPAQVILDWAVGRELLAMGAPATSWFGGMFAGGVAVSAEGSFSTPLLLAHSFTGGGPSAARILVASDGLEGSDQLVAFAGRLARAQGTEVILVHALGHERVPHRHHTRERVEEQMRGLRLAVEGASERVETGNPRTVILETAHAAGAWLVVMSSRRLQGLRAIGSVSRRVIHGGECSVLLIPPEWLLQR
jgi:nucleotide-binding universal stress UspA family protein